MSAQPNLFDAPPSATSARPLLRMISESGYAAIEVDAILTLASGEVLRVTAFPDGRPWAKQNGHRSRPVRRDEIVAVR